MKNSHAILICTEREMKFFRIQSKLLQVLKLFLHSHHLPSRFFLLVLILLYARNFRRRRHIFAKIIFKKKRVFFLAIPQTSNFSSRESFCVEMKNAEAKSLISASIRKAAVCLEIPHSISKGEKSFLGLKLVTEIEIKCLIVCLQAED